MAGPKPRRSLWIAFAVASLVATGAAAQQQTLTINDVYGPDQRLTGRPVSGLRWIDGSHYAWPRRVAGRVTWTKVDAASGAAEPLFDADRMAAALAGAAGVARDEADRLAHSGGLVFNTGYTAALLTIADDLYVYSFDTAAATRLTREGGAETLASFSPDGARVAFVRGNNLFTADLATGTERQLTRDGSDTVLNGRLDWVYEEEIFGRGTDRSYWWSPDSTHLAFLRLDDAPVPGFVIVDSIPYGQRVEHQNYPRAGDPNPTVRLGVAAAAGGPPTWVDTSKYTTGDHLIVSVSWTPDSQRVVFSVQNRVQTWLDLNVAQASTGAGRTLLRETSPAWVSLDDRCTDPTCGTDDPIWLRDGSFLRMSSQSGWPHLYHYAADGTRFGPVTQGQWELRVVHGVDEAHDWVYFSGTERSPIGLDVYRIHLDGSGLQRLSTAPGTHEARFSPDFSYYLDAWSDVVTPTQTRLVRAGGETVRTIDENRVPELAQYRLSKPEFQEVKTRDGFEMESMMIKPPGFDPSRRYPVYQFVYGGPHLPQVRNRWGGSQYLYHQLLAERDIIVWICDNRSASGKGMAPTWAIYRNFGELELRDIEDGLSWLKRQPYVDGSRIGIHGWSFGGYLTSYALTHSTSFVMGIAGGTVSDWRDYDSVYTERYMGLPQDNPEGYRRSSPRWAAANLHGALLLIHGAVDDNVHPQNTMQFAYELQKAQKDFRLMLYPKSRHAVSDPVLVRQMRQMMLDFTLAHLAPGDAGRTPTAR